MPTASALQRFDDALRASRGAAALVGVDEAGRGPLAGPVVAAAVWLGPGAEGLSAVRDSKTLSARRREELAPLIRKAALGVGVGWASAAEIDARNILQATFLAMRRALARLGCDASAAPFAAVDGNREIPGIPLAQMALVDGDAYSLAIAAASVVAKVARDRWMSRLDRVLPGYGFARHKGYGTPEHLEALARLGPSRVHRRSFAPVAQAALPLSR